MSKPEDPKQRLRARYLAWREAVPSDRHRAWSRDTCGVLADSPPVRDARDLLLYYPIRGEVDLRPLAERLSRRAVRVYLPRVLPSRRGLAVHEVSDPDRLFTDPGESDLVTGAYGVMEPHPDRCRTADLEELDAALVPGVVFDRSGFRIGYGEGYYDRLLARFPPGTFTVGVCFGGQLHDEALPTADHDQSVDWIACETEGFRCGDSDFGSS